MPSSAHQSLAGYTYLGLRRVIRINYMQPQVWLDLWGGTSGIFNGFDIFNRITDQFWQNYNTSTDLDEYQYGYDQNSNRLWKANVVGTPIVSGGLDEYYNYDDLNRLTQMQRGTLNDSKTGITGTPAIQQNWTLDPTGNWNAYVTAASGSTTLNQTRTQNTINQITAIGGSPSWATPPGYDDAGNMTTFPQTASPSSAYAATYNAWNQLVSVSASDSTIASYSYDGRKRRIIQNSYTGGSLSGTRHFYFTDDWQDIEERVGTSTSMDVQFVWGIRYIDELVCRDDATPLRMYAAQDANFNLTALISSSSGAVQQRFLYDPYGNSAVLSASWSGTTDSYAWQYRHQGGRFDPVTSLYLFRYRDYSPSLGNWLSRDPIGDVAKMVIWGSQNVDPTTLTALRIAARQITSWLGWQRFSDAAAWSYASGLNLYELEFGTPTSRSDASGLQAPEEGPGCPCNPYDIAQSFDCYLKDKCTQGGGTWDSLANNEYGGHLQQCMEGCLGNLWVIIGGTIGGGAITGGIGARLAPIVGSTAAGAAGAGIALAVVLAGCLADCEEIGCSTEQTKFK